MTNKYSKVINETHRKFIFEKTDRNKANKTPVQLKKFDLNVLSKCKNFNGTKISLINCF